MMTTAQLQGIADEIRHISQRAGRAILDVYEQEFTVTPEMLL